MANKHNRQTRHGVDQQYQLMHFEEDRKTRNPRQFTKKKTIENSSIKVNGNGREILYMVLAILEIIRRISSILHCIVCAEFHHSSKALFGSPFLFVDFLAKSVSYTCICMWRTHHSTYVYRCVAING